MSARGRSGARVRSGSAEQEPLARAARGVNHGEYAMHAFSRRNAIRGFMMLVAGLLYAPTSRSIAGEEAPLAIRGYDPVAYFAEGKPMRGLPEIACVWADHRSRFLSAYRLEIFRAYSLRY